MKKKLGLRFVISPLIVMGARLIVSSIFWILRMGESSGQLLIVIKNFINRWLWLAALASMVLFYVGMFRIANANQSLTVGDIIRYARQHAKKYMSKFLLGFALYCIVQIVSNTLGYSEEMGKTSLINLIVTIITFFASFRLGLWFANLSLHIIRQKTCSINDVFVDIRRTIKYLGAYLLVVLMTVIWLVLLIVPGIIVSVRLSMVPYLMLDKKLWGIDAIKTSWNMTKGYFRKIVAVNFVWWLINVLWMLALFVWLLWTVPLLLIANAYLYADIAKNIQEKKIPEIKKIPAKK